jgi:hypothetical protein
MQQMRNSAIILAVLLTATPTLAAEQCIKIAKKYADTAHCFLRIDGKVIINRTCRIGISGDLRNFDMDGVAEALMDPTITWPPVFTATSAEQRNASGPRIRAANLLITVASNPSTPGKNTFAGATNGSICASRRRT